MRRRKLYHLLAVLSPAEWEQLGAFLRSPFFNTNATLITFWELWLERILKRPEEADPTPEAFVAGSSIPPRRVDPLCRDLLALVRKFLVVKTVETSPSLNTILFARSLFDRDKGLNVADRFLPQLDKELAHQSASPEKQLARLYFEAMKSSSQIVARKADTNWLAG